VIGQVALNEATEVLRMFGRHGNAELKILSDFVRHFNEVLNTPEGKAQMDYDVKRWNYLARKCIRETVTVEEKAELVYITRRLDEEANKLYTFLDLHKKVTDKLEKQKEGGV